VTDPLGIEERPLRGDSCRPEETVPIAYVWVLKERIFWRRKLEIPFEQGISRRSSIEIIRTGLAWGGVSFIAAMLVILVLKFFLPTSLWGANAGSEVLNANLPVKILSAILLGPLFETVIGQVLPLEVLRRLYVKPLFCIIIGSAMWAIGHYLNGGLAHGVVSLCGGAVFAFIYIRYRNDGIAVAYWATFIAHATHNTLVLIFADFFPN